MEMQSERGLLLWNAACAGIIDKPATDGDRALLAVILGDGLAQSADLVDAISRLGPETQDVLEGFRWFGLDELASCWIEVLRLYPVDGIEDEKERDDLLERLPEDVQERCEGLASRYERVDATELIYAAFLAKLAVTPAAFSFLDAVQTARVLASNAWLSAQVREIEEKGQA